MTRGRSKVDCEDCGESPQTYVAADGKTVRTRRSQCKRCGLKVCGWCMHHVHRLAQVRDTDTRANITKPSARGCGASS